MSDLWDALRPRTAAPIGLGRTGNSLPTTRVLEFAAETAAERADLTVERAETTAERADLTVERAFLAMSDHSDILSAE